MGWVVILMFSGGTMLTSKNTTRPDGRQGQALVYGLWFGSWFLNHGSVNGFHGFVHDLIYGSVHGSWCPS